MTRQTRVGLLIGLGFVVVFGLVLSELTTPQSSALTPSADKTRSTYPHTYVIDETRSASGDRTIRISRSGSVTESRSGSATESRSGSAAESHGNRPGATSVARRSSILPSRAANVRRTPSARMARYAVQRGDTLIGIARKVYGRDHERQYKRIFQANRRILSDESAVSPGQVLVIPPLSHNSPAPERTPGSPAEPRQPLPRAETNLTDLPRPVAAAITRRPNQRVYVVKRGDSLSEIAYSFYSDDSRQSVMKIYEANEAKLRGKAHLPPGLTLIIPG